MNFAYVVFVLMSLFVFPELSHASSELGGSGDYEFSPRGLYKRPVRPRAVNTCSQEEKDKNTELNEKCLNDFSSMGLPKKPKPHEIAQKNSCTPSAEENIKRFSAGCLQYFANSVSETPKAVLAAANSALGFGKYEAMVRKKCGLTPRRRMNSSRNVAAQPDGQKRYNLMSSEAKYRSSMNAFEKCYSRVIADHEKTTETDEKNYKTSMRDIDKYCAPTRKKFLRNKKQFKKRLTSCKLEAVNQLGIDCKKCLKEISPDVDTPENSSLFASVLNDIKEYNPKAFQCYSPEKVGELACTAVVAAVGGATGAVALAKLAKAVGKKAADRAVAKAAKAAAAGAGDSKETRKALAEAVLRRDGLLGRRVALSDEQAEAIWKAHQLSDDKIAEKARILSEAGFSKDQRAALIRGDAALSGNGVTGGYSSAPSGAVDPNEIIESTMSDFRQNKFGYPQDQQFIEMKLKNIKQRLDEARLENNNGLALDYEAQLEAYERLAREKRMRGYTQKVDRRISDPEEFNVSPSVIKQAETEKLNAMTFDNSNMALVISEHQDLKNRLATLTSIGDAESLKQAKGVRAKMEAMEDFGKAKGTPYFQKVSSARSLAAGQARARGIMQSANRVRSESSIGEFRRLQDEALREGGAFSAQIESVKAARVLEDELYRIRRVPARNNPKKGTEIQELTIRIRRILGDSSWTPPL